MDPNNGKLQMIQSAEEARLRGLVPVRRDLKAKELADMQIRLYSPCGCGSGKKFKFCHYRSTTPDQPTGAVTVGCPECGGGQWYVSTAVEQCRNCGYSRPNQAEQK